MKAFFLLLFYLFFTLTFSQIKNNSIGFIENKGQIVDQKNRPNTAVKYLLNTNGLNVQLKEKGFSYDVYQTEKHLKKKNKETNSLENKQEPEFETEYKFHRIDFTFLSANNNAKLIPEKKSIDYDNYYTIVHASNGITNVHKYQKVTYQNIYNQIDVVFFIPTDSTKVVEYNFIVKPGGKISDIQLKIEGGKTELVENKIKMYLRFGEMEETIPLSWTEQENKNSIVKINYKQLRKNVYGFEGDLNSSDKTIVIDPVPVRLWGSYYGGSGDEYANDITSDNNNNIYISGTTSSLNNIATFGTHLTSIQNSGGFIAKFNANGNRLWGTYYLANTRRLKIDSNFNVYCAGASVSSPYITTIGAYQESNNGFSDAFLLKLNNNGIREWATFFGGEGNENSFDVSFDTNNNAYLCGYTTSFTNISTLNCHQAFREPTQSSGTFDAFIVKFNENGARQWSTYYGGEGSDTFYNCYYSNNFIYLTGNSGSTFNISTPGSYQENNAGSIDAMIVKIDLNGNRVWGTYIGGNGQESFDYRADLKNEYIYLIGRTSSQTNIATTGTFVENFQLSQNASNAFQYSNAIIKFNILNQSKIWGTYFLDEPLTVKVNEINEVYVSGNTRLTTGIATNNAYQPNLLGYSNAFIIKLNELGQQNWGTYYSGNVPHHIYDTRLVLDTNNNIYTYGRSLGTQLSLGTPNSHQETAGSHQDTFIAKFLDCQSSGLINSNSPLCIGNNLELTASGGTNYSWTGPNGFTSTEQNPTILNANSTHSGQYSCAITGIGGCDNTINITVIVGDSAAPIPTISNLPTIIGDCNTIISTIPTATDNCAGLINATTTNALNYSLPGNYIVTWNYTDGNGNSNSQTQNVTISSVAVPTLTSPQQFCIQQNATLNNIAITGQNIQWYDTSTGGNLLPNTTHLQNGTTYYASQSINGCESTRVPVLVTVQNTPAPTGNPNQSFCSTENATLNNITVNGTNIIWYSNLIGTTTLPTSTLLQNGVTYYASQTINGCESISRLAISIQLINTLNASNYSETICDELNNGLETANLSNYNSYLISSTGNVFHYYHSFNGAQNQITSDEVQNSNNYNLSIGNNQFYVRIESPNTCFQIVTLNLTLVRKPFININDIMPICEGNSITIDAGIGYDNYNWSTSETSASIIVSQPGIYSVTVSENHGTLVCTTTKNFTVVNSNIATISEIITSDWTHDENTISVTLSSNSVGDYEYSLNGIDFQESNTFYGLENGEYTVFIRDKNGCGISSQDVYLLMYPKYFTPNGDGFNDFWKINFSENEPNLLITIFDRYGKLIKQFYSNSNGWDGTFNGKQLPSTDYWFLVRRENGIEHRGHFSLKR